MPEQRELARRILKQSDEELARNCEWQPIRGSGGRLQHRLKHAGLGISVDVEPLKSDAQTLAVAIVRLRNVCYDLRSRSGKKTKPQAKARRSPQRATPKS